MQLPHEEYSYAYAVERLGPGCSLGNLDIYVYVDRLSNLSGVWCAWDNSHYLSKLELAFHSEGEDLAPKTTTFAPAYQFTDYESQRLCIRKLAFVPYGCGYLRTAYQVISVENTDDQSREVDILVRARYAGVNANEACKAPDFDDLEQRVDVRQAGDRFIIANSPRPYSRGIPGDPLRCRVLASTLAPLSHVFARPSRSDIRYRVTVAAHATVEFPLVYVISNEGEPAALAACDAAMDYRAVLAQTIANLAAVKETCDLMTPDPLVNRGVFWSKINTVRVQHRYPLGYGFTNMPPYDIVVIRDSSWYTLGCNYLAPEFSRRLIETAARHCVYDTGQLTEYIKLSAPQGVRDVYGISLNDCTPMFMVALYKHYALTRDETFLRAYYPIVERAAEYILAQMRDGLVFASTPGTSMCGVVGWRNVLAGDHINGFVPELNAECFFALSLASELAAQLGRAGQAAQFLSAARQIKEQMNTRLVSERTGLYCLAVDQWGERRHEITADLAVPAMYDLPDPGLKTRILALLLSPQFWTPYGCRTVGSAQPEYDPEYRQSGSDQSLMGGIWPNLAGWVAYAGRQSDPARVAEALCNIYRISEPASPVEMGHVCPGEFPECLHGETFASLGMKASPWTPPSYLWLAMEGLVGLEPRAAGVGVEPSLPPEWGWMALKDVWCGGGQMSIFYWDGVLYSSQPLRSSLPVEVYPDRLDCCADAPVYAIALCRGGEAVVFAAASQDVDCSLKISDPGGAIDRSVPLQLKAGNAIRMAFPADA
jgi:glycogen debranching enzyme